MSGETGTGHTLVDPSGFDATGDIVEEASEGGSGPGFLPISFSAYLFVTGGRIVSGAAGSSDRPAITPDDDPKESPPSERIQQGRPTDAGVPMSGSTVGEDFFFTDRIFWEDVGVRAALILTPGLAASREFDHAWAEGQYIDAAGWLVVGTGEMLLFAVSLGQSQTINAAVRGAMTSTAVVATTGEQVVTGAARGAASLAERAAAAGVRYPRQAEQALAMTRQQLQSSAMAFTENIAKHQGFLKNPQAHVPNWNQLSRQHQQNLIHHWKSDIARAEAYRDIAEAVLGGIFK